MRVLHVTTGRVWRGGEHQAFLLMEGLRARGEQQLLIAPTQSELARRAAEAGHAVRAVPIRNEGDLLALAKIVENIRRWRPDVLHLHTSQAHGLGAAAARLAGRRRPAVVVTRRVEHSIFRHSFLGLDRWKYAPGADRVLCVSERVRQVLLADGLPEALLRVVPDGVDVDRFATPTRDRRAVRAELGLSDDAEVIGTVGQLETAKGQADLIAALPEVLAAVGQARLLVVGRGRAKTDLEEQASRYGVAEHVTFAGHREDVPDLLHAMDVFAFPSRTEGLGSSVLEALAAGVPVVASRVGGLPEVLRQGQEGLLCEPGDPHALADALVRVLQDPEAARARAQAGRGRVRERWTAQAMVEATAAAYADVVSDRRG